jgi:hypothetical protein
MTYEVVKLTLTHTSGHVEISSRDVRTYSIKNLVGTPAASTDFGCPEKEHVRCIR